jgi:hypothetical protein
MSSKAKAKDTVLHYRPLVSEILAYVPLPMVCRAARTSKMFASEASNPSRYEEDAERLKVPAVIRLVGTARDSLWREFGSFCYHCGDWAKRVELKQRPNRDVLWWLGNDSAGSTNQIAEYSVAETDLAALFYGRGICDACFPAHLVMRAESKDAIPPWASGVLNKRYIEVFDMWLYSEEKRKPGQSVVVPLAADEQIIWKDAFSGLRVRTAKNISVFNALCNVVNRARNRSLSSPEYDLQLIANGALSIWFGILFARALIGRI